MFYSILTVVALLGFSTVDGSKENLPPIDNTMSGSSLPSSALQQVETNAPIMTKSDLRRYRHKLRMSLMAKSSPRIYPPTGERRRQLELKLAEIEQVLKQTP